MNAREQLSILHESRGFEDVGAEFYRTPRHSVRALIARGILPADVPWMEPCAGDGAIIRAVPEVSEWWASDLRSKERVGPETLCTPERVNCPLNLFTDAARDWVQSIEPGVIITNPPNSLAWEIALLLRQWCPDAYVAILQPVAFGCTMGRLPAILRDPPDCYRLAQRPDFIGRGGMQEYAWWVWSPGSGGAARFEVLPPEGWKEEEQGALL